MAGREQTTGELERLLAFFYRCPVGLVELDGAGRVTLINPAAVQMLGPVEDGGLQGSDGPWGAVGAALRGGAVAPGGPSAGLPDSARAAVVPGLGAEQFVEVRLVRVTLDQVVVVLVDVSQEWALARREREVTLALQTSMLGVIDEIEHLALAVTYQVAEQGRQIGGDWYDVIDLAHGRVGLVVGDVVGHNLQAAATMGQLRTVMRSLALDHDDPGDFLEHADAFARRVAGAECTTAAYVVLEQSTGLIRHSSAGHPPLLVVRSDGSTEFLWTARQQPLACLDRVPRSSDVTRLGEGDLLVMYTDGLVERRGRSLREGMRELADLAASARDLPPPELCRGLVAGMSHGVLAEDDVCLLVMRHTASAETTAVPGHVLGPVPIGDRTIVLTGGRGRPGPG